MSKTIGGNVQVLTANRLGDGIVVFLSYEAGWIESIDGAALARSPDEVRNLELRGASDAARNVVVDPYLVEFRERAGQLEPVRVRERVRISGPSVLGDVPGYQAPIHLRAFPEAEVVEAA
jgi:hypothetical protein